MPSLRPVAPTAAVYDQAVALLDALSGPNGIHASLAATTNYRAVFTRDAVMAGVAALLADRDAGVAAFVRTLECLRQLQGARGQIASNYQMRDGAAPAVSFGSLAPRIDAATWYLASELVSGRSLRARSSAVRPRAAVCTW